MSKSKERSRHKEYVECDCNSMDCVIRLELEHAINPETAVLLDKDLGPWMDISVNLDPHDGFWKRVLNAIRYVFRRYQFCGVHGLCWWESNSFSQEGQDEAKKMIGILQRYVDESEAWREAVSDTDTRTGGDNDVTD